MEISVLRSKSKMIREKRCSSREEMKSYIEALTGEGCSFASFDSCMRELLPKESFYQDQIIRWLKATYKTAFVWKAAAGPYSRQGIPDVCAVIGGRFFGFEVKRPYIGKLSKIQEETIDEIRQAGGIVAVVSWPEQCEEIITRELKT